MEPVFLKLNREYNFPDVFAHFQKMRCPIFLDSSSTTSRIGRFSYITADPFMTVTSKGKSVHIDTDGKTTKLESSPFLVLKDLLKNFQIQPIPDLAPFQGGAIGYFAYELAHHLEKLPSTTIDDLNLPDAKIGLYDWVIARDHLSNSTWIVSTGLPKGGEPEAFQRLEWVKQQLAQIKPTPYSITYEKNSVDISSNFSRDSYIDAVNIAKDYIANGDIYQTNISQRFESYLTNTPWETYLNLREITPSPFGAFMDFPEITILSASPEKYIHLENNVVSTRPMKGTRPRGGDENEDLQLANELFTSEKDRAENIMIVDVLRNDLGKVCVPGSIQVPSLFQIEKHATVFQMVSSVRGRMKPSNDGLDLLQACFPGGSVTGAPKIRAMEIIDELEPTQRSVYCGAIGYIGFDGSMLTSIPIRILIVKEGKFYLPVGAGIVADSNPSLEYVETLDKARGALMALGYSDRNLPFHLKTIWGSPPNMN